MKKKNLENIGVWAFYIGLVITILVALFQNAANPTAIFIVGLLGIIVGLLNVTAKEVQSYLIAAISFVLSFTALEEIVRVFWTRATVFFNLLVVFIACGAAIVALKEIYAITKEK
ncbi:MAG: hypothetical protein ACP5OZ_01450 [Candidatus Woesearchaeota archaeon]